MSQGKRLKPVIVNSGSSYLGTLRWVSEDKKDRTVTISFTTTSVNRDKANEAIRALKRFHLILDVQSGAENVDITITFKLRVSEQAPQVQLEKLSRTLSASLKPSKENWRNWRF